MSYLDTARRFVAGTHAAPERTPDTGPGPHERDESDEESHVAPAPPSFDSSLSSAACAGPACAVASEPEPAGPARAATAANALALTAEERRAWQREIVAALRWEEAGNGRDPNLSEDVSALRQVVPDGVCLDCGGHCPRDGRHWCQACETR